MNLTLLWNTGILRMNQMQWVFGVCQQLKRLCGLYSETPPSTMLVSFFLELSFDYYLISELVSSKTGHPYDSSIAVHAGVVSG